jgi:hypothetical protein
VTLVRRLFLKNHWLTAWFVVIALAMKLLTPTGYMFVQEADGIAVILCPGTAPATDTPKMPAMAGMDHGGEHGSSKEHGKTEMPCAFAGLSGLALGAVDAVLLAAALAFVAVLALRPARLRPLPRAPYLRPPLRGPPAYL